MKEDTLCNNFQDIRLLEQTEQKLRRIQVCLENKKEKISNRNSRALLLYKRPD